MQCESKRLRRPKWLWLWPGLRRLWIRGSWRSLAIATTSGLMLSGLLAVTLVWTEVLTAAVRGTGWIVIVAIWVVSAVAARRVERKGEAKTVADEDVTSGNDSFSDAMTEYLKGNYLEAERQIRPLVAGNADDVESRLLLATLLRRSGRSDEARGELQRLEKSETAHRWQCEIKQELAAIDDKLTTQQAQSAEADQTDENLLAENDVEINHDQTTSEPKQSDEKRTNQATAEQSDTSADMTKAA